MLTHPQLVALHQSLRDQRVLSVYIDGSASDPASQRSWRLELDHGLNDVKRGLDGSPAAERDEFEQCVKLLDVATSGFPAGIGAPGWAAFITANGVQGAQRLPVPTPTLAVWSVGPCLGPYVRALKELRSVVVVVADARRATIYRYQQGELDRIDTVRAYHTVDHPEHMGTPAHVGFHAGTRGIAGHDAAQRSLLTGRDRMLADAADRTGEIAGHDGWILIGGIKRVTARLAELLEVAAPNRVLELESLDVHSTEAQISELARSGASQLRNAADERRLAEIIETAGAHGLGAVGPAEARKALGSSSVRDLYITHRFVEEHASETEEAVRAALDQDALVEEVSGIAADRLNHYGGMAAGLRFRSDAVPSIADV